MAGIPPLIGFFAKQMVLYSSIHNGYYFISVIAILVSVISASYYLKIIQTMYFDKIEDSSHNLTNNAEDAETDKNHEISNIENFRPSQISNLHSITISIITIVITMFIIHPSIITNFCQILRLSIFTY
jgi:NADH-ubiquinone oxidoreductase chain 2